MSNDPRNGNTEKSSADLSPDSLAAYFVAGAMTGGEHREFESRLDGDQSLCDALRSFDGVSDLLLEQIEPVQPAPGIRKALLARIEAEAEQALDAEASPARVIRRAGEANGWQETGVAGVTLRVLFADQKQKRMTALLRMEPGAVFPSHVHGQAEECLMLEGDLDFGDYTLSVGDYVRLEPGSKHSQSRTEHGCLCLVTAELPDSLVA